MPESIILDEDWIDLLIIDYNCKINIDNCLMHLLSSNKVIPLYLSNVRFAKLLKTFETKLGYGNKTLLM